MSRHLVLCGGLTPARNESGERLDLAIGGAPDGIDLGIEQLRRKMVSNLPETLMDLLEIATYIYAADSHARRGGRRMRKLGSDWRRQFKFAIPVRSPELWSSRGVRDALAETVGFLSDDSYEFRFERLENPTPWPAYFEFGGERGEGEFVADEILLLSGGLDSLAGTLAEILDNHHRVALVSHRSSPKMLGDQRKLLKALEAKIGAGHFWHVPVRLTLAAGTADERTHRTRSFLYSALGVVVAVLFRRRRIRFFENGVISLHLPISAHALGSRATRSTHPRVLDGLTKLFSQLLGEPFEVDNPFFWKTKADIVESIVRHGHGDLIAYTRSCANTRDQTKIHPHCGCCSQCIDRRFSTLAAAPDCLDPDTDYRIDLLQGPRDPYEQISMLASYVSTVSKIEMMTDRAFFSAFGEAARVYRYLSDPPAAAGEKIFQLYKRHAVSVCGVLDKEIAKNASLIRANSLPPSCLLMIAASQRSGEVRRPAVSDSEDASNKPQPGFANLESDGRPREPVLYLAFDDANKHVLIEKLGVISGPSFELLNALRASFRNAGERELRPELYPFVKTIELAHMLTLEEGSLRKRVYRFRNEDIPDLCRAAGAPALPEDAILENLPWHGYRLNPFRVRLVSPTHILKR